MSKRGVAVVRWREVLRRQVGSGLSVAAFCRRSRIPESSFYFWRRRLRGAAGIAKLRDEGTFTEVRVGPASERDGGVINARGARDGGRLELVLSGGRRIVVRPDFDRATLLALVDALEGGTGEVAIPDQRPAFHGISVRRETGA